MPRVTSSASSRRRKKFIKMAKGYRGGRSNLYRQARESINRALAYAYRDRRRRKRDFRRLWIIRINAATRLYGLSYNIFMASLRGAGVKLNRKALADLAVNDPVAFAQVVETAKQYLSRPPVPDAGED